MLRRSEGRILRCYSFLLKSGQWLNFWLGSIYTSLLTP
uniref:Uncharacterized protein n=1 Tax=Arundo donax TaxID=35708 RepID=A0A0A8ZWT8_ARUDO